MKRHELATFVDTTGNGGYALLGTGIETLTYNYNPETETKQWINQESATTLLKSYGPEFSVDIDTIESDTAITWAYNITWDLPTGADCQFDVVTVDLTQKTGNVYKAKRRKYAVTANTLGGDAGGSVIVGLNFGGMGDYVNGTFEPDGQGGGTFVVTT